MGLALRCAAARALSAKSETACNGCSPRDGAQGGPGGYEAESACIRGPRLRCSFAHGLSFCRIRLASARRTMRADTLVARRPAAAYLRCKDSTDVLHQPTCKLVCLLCFHVRVHWGIYNSIARRPSGLGSTCLKDKMGGGGAGAWAAPHSAENWGVRASNAPGERLSRSESGAAETVDNRQRHWVQGA